MISSTLFITYTIMCFLGLQAITLVLFIIKHNDSGTTRLLKAARDFVIVSIVLGLFYYITYYRELVQGEFATNIFLRGLDAVVFYAMGYSWVRLVDAIIDSPNPKMAWWRKHTSRIFILLMAVSAAAYIFLLDEYYSTDYPWAEVLVIALEVILGITVIVFSIAYIRAGYKNLTDSLSRQYIIAVTILINFNNLWNNIVVIAVFLQAVSLTMWCTKLYGITSIALLIVNLLTVIYIYKKDFSPIYFQQRNEDARTLSEEESLDQAAQKYRLTERERDVMVLAYQGLTNPDIAEKLFISKHTVKRHMHNIFEKFSVSSRMELIHHIKSQTASK